MYCLRYTHPAAYIFDVDKVYTLDELKDQYQQPMEMIKVLFTPINFQWSDIDETVVIPVEPVAPVENETQSIEVSDETTVQQ